ncbi:hypothetical protein J4474_04525 [Candidatus Pacearchaeota archaeon]|nr:hypothetical protein [Candidatus Pacearchaeota archaeon]
MNYDYEVYTTIPRNFDPDVEGTTLDSIMASCKGYVNHSIPLGMRDSMTTIKLSMSQPLDTKYLIDQLNDNFGENELGVVKRITRKDLYASQPI